MHYDFIIIGSGAGGSAAAYKLAMAGKQVLLLEKGNKLPEDGSTLDFKRVINEGIFKSKEPWLDRRGKRFCPEEYFNLGGKTKWYGAALLRFDETEFAADPDFQCLGWPLTYQDLAPYYDEVENLLGIRSFPIEPDLEVLRKKIDHYNSGWRCVPLPLALNPEILAHEKEARHFDGFASQLGLKADGQTSLLAAVSTFDNLRILTGQPVEHLIGDDTNPQRILGVMLENGQRYTADNYLLAAGALHSPRLLQDYLEISGIAKILVGRYFKRHLLTALLTFSLSRKTDVLRKTMIWFNDRYPHSSIQPLGFGEDVLASLIPGIIPRWLARQLGSRAYGFFLQTEDGSNEDNRVVSAASDAKAGLQKLDYDLARLPAAKKEHRQMIRSFRHALRGFCRLSLVKSIPLAGTAHACGTLITGNDPHDSVVDRNGKVHGLNNLYVVDGSILPRSSRVNPALTIYAWALRTADHLLQRSTS